MSALLIFTYHTKPDMKTIVTIGSLCKFLHKKLLRFYGKDIRKRIWESAWKTFVDSYDLGRYMSCYDSKLEHSHLPKYITCFAPAVEVKVCSDCCFDDSRISCQDSDWDDIYDKWELPRVTTRDYRYYYCFYGYTPFEECITKACKIIRDSGLYWHVTRDYKIAIYEIDEDGYELDHAEELTLAYYKE